MRYDKAVLALADGSTFLGRSIGAKGEVNGEVVFNTAMTGYQEILTDPSYARQIVTLTYPHIGNTGINSEDVESDQIWTSGLVIKNLPVSASSWRKNNGLEEYLIANNTVGISNIDTRRLTSLIRKKGAQSGAIIAGDNISEDRAISLAKEFSGLSGLDLAQEVSTKEAYKWEEGEWRQKQDKKQFKVVALDFGIKKNILRILFQRGCEVTVLPAKTSYEEILKLKPDGVFLSNGPGDPEPCTYAILTIKELLKNKIPIFGICLGHQLLSIALGGKTEKMKFGHHGANHPVKDLNTHKVFITSQNHGFTVKENSLPGEVRISHRSLFDDTIQGISHSKLSAFSFQGHPEASPGPHDISSLFNTFLDNMKSNNAKKN
tara:strand:- start:424 stop:1551 length:1128 start_codon:yes stop_codon:yes gene_type:complete